MRFAGDQSAHRFAATDVGPSSLLPLLEVHGQAVWMLRRVPPCGRCLFSARMGDQVMMVQGQAEDLDGPPCRGRFRCGVCRWSALVREDTLPAVPNEPSVRVIVPISVRCDHWPHRRTLNTYRCSFTVCGGGVARGPKSRVRQA